MKSNKKTSINVIKKIICFGIVTTSAAVTIVGFATADEIFAAEAKEETVKVVGIQNNGYNGIKININAEPYTTLAKVEYAGQYAYGKSGCAWFASSRVKQITGKCSTIWGGPSWYNTQYKNYGFTRGSIPRANSLACFEGHVGYVESVSEKDMVISEGGSWYYSDAEHGYCVIRKTDIKKYETGMGSKFLGYVYLDGYAFDTATIVLSKASEPKSLTVSSSTAKPVPAKTSTTKSVSTESDATKNEVLSENIKAASESEITSSKWVKDKKTGKFMYYGANGKKYTGWHYMGSAEGEKTPHWSYFGKDGILRTGWQKMGTKANPDGDDVEHWSYFGPNGWLRTGWQKMGTKVNPDGKNKAHWSYYGSNGWLRTGWQKMGTKNNPDGKSKVHQSYFGSNGWLVTGKKIINGKTYTFNSSGWKI